MAATSSSTSTHKPKRTATKRYTKKLPHNSHEPVSKSPLTKQHSSIPVEQLSTLINNNIDIDTSATMLLNNIAHSDVTYNANAIGPSNVRRIRTPAPHDVLSGRGGSVNAHPGNCQFRDWVQVRKEEYNLARSKQAKADICRDIIAKVTALGGRFLTKENPNSQWWVEQDDERMMSKTSQALREGAPKIREAHRDELGETTKSTASRRKLHASANNNPTAMKRSFKTSESAMGGKRVRVDYKGQAVFPNQSSPSLRSTPAPLVVTSSTEDMPGIQLTSSNTAAPVPRPFRFPPPLLRGNIAGTPTSSQGYKRTNSLATSDIVNIDDNLEFVNPFEDESYLFESTVPPCDQPMEGTIVEPNTVGGSERTLSDSASSRDSSVVKSGILRESSLSSTMTDFAGYGALVGGINSHNNFNESLRSMNSMGNISLQSESNTRAHVVPVRSTSAGSVSTVGRDDTYKFHDDDDDDDDDVDDNRSVATEATLGLPLWDWFNRDVSASTISSPATSSDAPATATTSAQQAVPIV